MTREEWEARVLLAACYRVFAHLGWTEMIYNHITLRVPGPDKHLLINPFGLHYTEITASNLVKIDLDGKILSDSPWPINPAGLAPHATVHKNIDNAHCVMHTHTTAGLAVACTRGGLSMTNFYSAQLYGKVAYHDFEGITVEADEGPRMLPAWAASRSWCCAITACWPGARRCRRRSRICGPSSARARSRWRRRAWATS